MAQSESNGTAEQTAILRPPCRELPRRQRRDPKPIEKVAECPSNAPAQQPATLPLPYRALRRRRAPKPIIIYPKLRYRRSERGERLLTVASLFAGTAQRPMIRIRGGWLEKLGFKIGARIVVSEEQGRLIVTLAGEE